ncbi:MAG TPA: ATP synthase F1 subunit epsilon [Acidimicrobiales bacterium]|nr:ATP synthase F1 subunit epsilon [Acidimicrobiales bacterium]
MPLLAASLVTPERIVLELEVQAVMVRTEVGEATFLSGHTPLVGALVPGLVRFQAEDGTETRAAVHGGFVQVDGEHVVVLSPIAELAGDIDVERARRALEAADQALAELGPRSEEPTGAAERAVVEAEEARRRAEVRLVVAGAASSTSVSA